MSKLDAKSEMNAAPLKITCESQGLKFSIPYADIRASQCIRRVDEKDEIDCNSPDQKSELILERSTLDVKCRLKIGQKMVGSGWTEVQGHKPEDLAHFECQSTLAGLAMDQKANSKVPTSGAGEEEPVHASLKLMAIGSYFQVQDNYVGTYEIFNQDNITPKNPAIMAAAMIHSRSLHSMMA